MTDKSNLNFKPLDPEFMIDAKGRHVPINLVSSADILEDKTVNRIVDFATDLSGQIARFKGHTFDDVNTAAELMGEQYGVHKGGLKGNMTFMSFDGCRKVQVQVADNIKFGMQLQVAKALIGECIEEWSDGSTDEIKVLVNHAFDVGKEGEVNRSALFALRRMKIKHSKWKQAMEAIADSVRIVGTKSYVRIYERENAQASWQMIQLNIAAV